ncbi:hypothetical protein Nmel_014928, partial [Mimus melanotis]
MSVCKDSFSSLSCRSQVCTAGGGFRFSHTNFKCGPNHRGATGVTQSLCSSTACCIPGACQTSLMTS